MANLAAVLKSEIRRLARREANALTVSLRKAVAQVRQQAWAANRRIVELQKQVADAQRPPAANALPEVEVKGITRLGPVRIRALRRRLGLSLAEFGKLIGATSNSVLNWEHARTKPNAKMRGKIIAARTLKKRAARKLLGQ